ncbi:MAG: hypothetical protein ABIH21_01040 [Patescibacteria group bacterium]
MSDTFRIILGLAVMVAGFVIVWKTRVLMSWFGANAWAEQKFGPGGSWLFYKLVGLLTAFIGIFIATGIINDILEAFASLFV